MTASIITLILWNFWSSLATLRILKALNIVIALEEAPPYESSKCWRRKPISALITMNMSNRFHLLKKYSF